MATGREKVAYCTDDEDDIPLSVMTIPVTQPVSFGPTWIDSPEELSPVQMGLHFK